MLLLALTVACASDLARADRAVIDVHVSSEGPIGKINDRYASWTIDSSYNRGFVHIDFTNANLLAAATSLAPSTMRFGGGGNDYLQYAPFEPCTSNNDSDTHVCLNTTHWNSLYSMATKTGNEVIFGLSFDMVKACAERDKYVWTPEAAIAMIKYIQSRKQTIWGFELGNEVNNRRESCGLEPAQQGAAFASFSKVLATLYPDASARPKILGPDVGYLSPELWLSGFLGNFSSLHAVTYHVYSWLSKKNFDFVMPIDNALRDGESWYPGLVRQMAPGAEIWAGEDGPISGGEDGTCGGKLPNGSSTNNSVCGTYATVPWYANDLGTRATLGFKQYLRQDLAGGRYGLVGLSHDSESLGKDDAVRIQPDFWVNFMWKRVMGATVYNATQSSHSEPDPALRAFAHCGQPPSPHAALSGATNPLGVVLININSTRPLSVHVPGASSWSVWTLSAPAGGVFGQASLLNGQPLPATLSEGVAIGAIPVAAVHPASDTLELPPFSVTFAAANDCAAEAVADASVA